MIKRLDDSLIYILGYIKDALMPIIVLILIIMLVKILIDYMKYGKKIFRVFKKQNPLNISKVSLEISIKNLNVYYKIISLEKNCFLLVLPSGLYILNVLDSEGIVTGKITDDKLVINANTKSQKQIDNPIVLVKKYIALYSKLVNEKIDGYVLLKKNCLFSVLNRTNIKVIPLNAFYYHFSKLVKNKKYDQTKIDNMYEKIVAK